MFKKESVFVRYFTFVILFYFIATITVFAQNQTQTGRVGFWGEVSLRFYCTFSPLIPSHENSLCRSEAFLQSISGGQVNNNQQPAANNGTTTIVNNYIVATNTGSNQGREVVYVPGPQGPQGPAGERVIIREVVTAASTSGNQVANPLTIFGGTLSFPFSGSAQFNGFGGGWWDNRFRWPCWCACF